MGGGLMQLVAYGAQDIYLTGNPQITFFKVVYRRHTNFSMEAIEQTLNGTVSNGANISATVSRNGDLVGRMYVEFNPNTLFKTTSNLSGDAGDVVTSNVGNTLLKSVELEIGGQQIDKHYSHWLTTYAELTESNPTGANKEISTTGGQPSEATLYQKMSYNHDGRTHINTDGTNNAPSKAFVPLQFWFNRNPGLALPLIALQYHEVKVKIEFCQVIDFALENGGGAANCDIKNGDIKLWADYIYLDTDERRRFAQVSHEYLIEQLQYESKTGLALELNFNHPVKELIWTGAPTDPGAHSGPGTPGVFSSPKNWHIKLNGHDRFEKRDYRYFTRTQIWQHHTGYGGTTAPDSIAVYSFALKPEEHQPSGTCNFSRIDNAQLITDGGATDTSYNVYAVNYNVLRIMSGMGGLAYSN